MITKNFCIVVLHEDEVVLYLNMYFFDNEM